MKNEYLVDYLMDEFGRVVIKDEYILDHINGTGEPVLSWLGSNNLCGSNVACANVKCE